MVCASARKKSGSLSPKRNDRPSRRLLVCRNRLEISSPRFERRPFLTAIGVQVVVPARDAGLHVIQPGLTRKLTP